MSEESKKIEDFLKRLFSKKNADPVKTEESIKRLVEIHSQIQERERSKNIKKQGKYDKPLRKSEEELEEARIEQITCMDLPLDYENFFENDARADGINVESVSDGLIASLNVLGKVDIEYISKISGLTFREVITSLKGSIYQNPNTWGECFYKGWETADEYLSGNLITKWKEAKHADNKYKGWFKDNVTAIEKILPTAVKSEDIFVTIGTPWIPADVIDDFIDDTFGHTYCSGYEYAKVKHDELTGTWDIPEKARYYNNAKVYSAYGTRRLSALHILEKTLNMRNVCVTDEIPCNTNASGKKRVINHEETLAAIEKQKVLNETFRKWIWKNDIRKERLLDIYETKYNCYRIRRYDGQFLNFPEMNSSISLRPHQKDAIARIIFSKGTLLAHDVGSGKTYVMIASGMELKRMGLSKRNLYVVPNNVVGQWEKMFINLYPNAKLLVIAPKDFTPTKKQATLTKMKYGEYDGIIIPSSCFDSIPLSHSYYQNKYKEKEERLNDLQRQAKKNTSGVRNEIKRLKESMQKLSEEIINGADQGITFDELNVTRLFVDEAHAYKNLPIDTKTNDVLGISSTGSKKCSEMLDKVRSVQKKGGGVIFATGTPITNSLTDAFVMQYYLQYGELELLDLQSFDSWIGMFAEKKAEFEIDVDTNKYRLATRFSKFNNLPELTSILSSIADFHTISFNDNLPRTDGYTDVLISKTAEFNEYLEQISKRADDVRSGKVRMKDDNMLKITTDGRKAALDLRTVDEKAKFTYNSKVYRCAENISNIYFKTTIERSAQLVFCDTSTPKAGFNVYDEVKKILVGLGVNPQEIAYVHDANTDAQREDLFRKVRLGVIRVLIGSTQKLGIGVNVQTKLIALHHLDVPWRPADMVQREGRIIREGNLNEKVWIYRYITEGSFDAYSWQLLESKQRFISAILSGSMKERCGSDISDTVLNYAEVKALAIGNPLIKKRVEVANELSRLHSLQRKFVENRWALQKELAELPNDIEDAKKRVEKCKADLEYFIATQNDSDKDERLSLAKFIFFSVSAYVMKEEDKKIVNYRGFDVILPKEMFKEKPYVYLQRLGRYMVEIGESDKGVMLRLDNCLESLDKRLLRYENAYLQLIDNQKNIEDELAKDENYDERILAVQEQLDKIDEKLGVNKSA